MLPLRMRNSGVRVVQIIWPPSDHLSKSPWILGRRCRDHPSSFASSLRERSKSEANPPRPLAGQVETGTSRGGKRAVRAPRSAAGSHGVPLTRSWRDNQGNKSRRGSSRIPSQSKAPPCCTGFIGFTARGSPAHPLAGCLESSRSRRFPSAGCLGAFQSGKRK